MPKNIEFIHGPGCPVCVMPKNRINQAYDIAMQKDTILLSLGDMIKIPGSFGSLADARARGASVQFLYSPIQALEIAKENPHKKVVFFAIGFETTTPMSAALIEKALQENVKNLFFHINHVLVPPPLCAILDSKNSRINALIAPSHVSVISGAKIYEDIVEKYRINHVLVPPPLCAILDSKNSRINALIAPSHVSVISGAKIYEDIVEKYRISAVVSGFEPVDMMESVYKLVKQKVENQARLEIQYKRVVSHQGNLKAQALVEKYFTKRESFEWRGLGNIADSALRLKTQYAHMDAEVIFDEILSKDSVADNKACRCGFEWRGLGNIADSALRLKTQYAHMDAEVIFDEILSKDSVADNKACRCGDILRGVAKPFDCKVFAKACTPSNPLGSCMVSSEGACAAYYKYGALQ